MGTTSSIADKIQPKDVIQRSGTIKDFGLNGKRHTTDTLCLLLHALFCVSLIPFLIYCIFLGDLYRIINGYDNCLNVCGRNNIMPKNDEKTGCAWKDMSTHRYIIVYRSNGKPLTDTSGKKVAPATFNNTLERVCLTNCSTIANYRSLFNKCVLNHTKSSLETFWGKSGLNNFFEEVSEDFQLCWRQILYLVLISLVFSLVIMILFRFLVGVVIWLVLIGVVLACIIGTIYLWILWKQSKSASDDGKPVTGVLGTRRTGSYLAFAIIATIVTICVLLIVLVLRKRVKLVIQMFKEAGKAIGSMPLVLLQPVWTFICIAIALGLWLYFTLWIESSGQKKRIRDDHYILEKDTLMIFTRFYNIFITLWLLQFLIGCQHMVIAGAIACWYFTRNKNHVKGPIAYGFYNLTRYHLGSVSFGSLVIAIIQMLRILLKMLETYLSSHNGKCASCLVKCCQCCLCCFESILKYLTRNAYIEIAIHGYNFCQAGKQAFKILTSNALRVGTINSVGDFVLFLGKVLVVVVTVLIGIELIQKKEGVLHSWVPLTFCGLIAYFISHCFLSVYEMAIDTIFICFCEDCEVNDGVSKPYYMSRSLMQFVENSNKSVLKSSMNNQAGQKGLVTVS